MKIFIAVIFLITALSINADYQQAKTLYNDAMAKLESGDIDRAFEIYQNAVTRDDSIFGLKNHVFAEFQMKKLEKETSFVNIAKAYYICGNYDKAKSFIRKVTEMFPATSKDFMTASALSDQIRRLETRKISDQPASEERPYVRNDYSGVYASRNTPSQTQVRSETSSKPSFRGR